MRPVYSICLSLAVFPMLANATGLRNFNDAALRDIHFVDHREGWAVGDEGVIWHTIDGGKNWERQSTGVRASLRSIYFVNPFVGWVVGRDELPLGAGSSGVLLLTTDGGEHWRQLAPNTMPGLNQIRFVNNKVGYVVGDATDQFPSGVFATKDGGRSWKPVEGPRAVSWNAFEMSDEQIGTLIGAWNQLATLRKENLKIAKVDQLGGRSLHSVYLTGGQGHRRTPTTDGRGVAVGQGGLLLMSQDSGATWGYLAPRLPESVLSCWDFHAVHGAGSHIWVAGRPGSVMLHSPDRGKTWEVQKTGNQLPLHSLFFHDEKRGWAVGELGSILATTDGGKTWKVQRRGGRRSAVMVIQTDSKDTTFGTIARVGAVDAYLTTVIQAIAPDPASASEKDAGQASRLARAVRMAGGAAGEMLWQFPKPKHVRVNDANDLEKLWDGMHLRLGKGAEQMTRQLTLALRIWRPEVVVVSGKAKEDPASKMVVDAIQKAFQSAGDEKAYPEQIQRLALSTWKPLKLYVGVNKGEGNIAISLTRPVATLSETLRDFVTEPTNLVHGKSTIVPVSEYWKLVNSQIPNAQVDRYLTQGIQLAYGGEARRPHGKPKVLTDELKRILTTQTTIQNLTFAAKKGGLTDPNRVMSLLGPLLDKLPPERGAKMAHSVARHYVRMGEWHLAREVFGVMVERFPAHELAMDAYRWLILHNSSDEVRRRHELGQFVVTGAIGYRQLPGVSVPKNANPQLNEAQRQKRELLSKFQTNREEVKEAWVKQSTEREIRDWNEGSIKLGPKLASFGALLGTDPATRFALASAKRKIGQFEEAEKWFEKFVSRQQSGPWKENAMMELWLSRRRGAPPKQLFQSRHASNRPYLDGKLDDPCWREGGQPVVLKNAIGTTGDEYKTKVMLTHDKDFLFLAVRCEHPNAEPVKSIDKRDRDMTLNNHDRISLFLDLDRDYSTAYHFQFDRRGGARESCWADPRWNPSWFVAVHQEATYWQAEIAIPRGALTGDHFMQGRPWCCNIVRVVPGQGVQAWSLPAGVPEANPKLEGMGMLLFLPKPNSQPTVSTKPEMKRAK